jgi:hypothetical protein
MRRRIPRVLCVSGDAGFVESTRAALGKAAELVVEPDVERALETLRTRPFAGALVDSRTAGLQTVRLAGEYLAHQPAGRVVLACPGDDSTALCNLAARDPRAETVFDPWDGGCDLRAILLGPVEMGSFTRRGVERRPLANLLKR